MKYKNSDDNRYRVQFIAEAEQREKARAEEKRRRKEIHDFCSSLRMSDEVYR